MDSHSPIVILLDFDGTIVGDVQWLAFEHSLIQSIGSGCRNMPRFMISDFKSGVLRPHFKQFIDHVKRYVPYIEFYIYTASTTEWASYIIPRVEKTLGVSLNRPLFTREHCTYKDGKYSKNLATVMPIIAKRLAKTYAPVKANGVHGIRSAFLIDNTPDVLTEHANLVLCPTYDYQLPIDVFRQLQSQIPVNVFAQHYMSLRDDAEWKQNVITNTCHEQRFMACYYQHLAKLHYAAHKQNKGLSNDTMWLRMAKAITSIDPSRIRADTVTKACLFRDN
jgi:hypothetical protein